MRKTLTMLGAIAALAIGSLLTAAPANAQVAIRTVPNGGVTCKQYAATGGSQPYFPSTFWDCTDTANPPTSGEKLIGSQARFLPTAIKNTLVDVQVMIFEDAAEFTAFTGVADPDLKPNHMAWVAEAGPNVAGTDGQWLHGKRIAAVFRFANVYSPNLNPNPGTIARRETGNYAVHILQALGRQYSRMSADTEPLALPQEEVAGVKPVHIFPIASEYDQFWTNRETISQVWGGTVAALPQVAGKTRPWDVLGVLYGNSYEDIYAFQFASEFGSNWSHLDQFITAYLKETNSYRYYEVFKDLHPGGLPVTGKYKKKDDVAGTRAVGVMCVEYTNPTYDAPANKLWDCIHPYNSSYAGERTSGLGVSQLSPTLKTDLVNYNVRLFIMRDIEHSKLYHEGLVGATADLGVWGISYKVDTGGDRVSAAFYRAFTTTDFLNWNTANDANGQLTSTLVHEVGHQLDGIWGRESDNDSAFESALLADLQYIDTSVTCTGMFSADYCNNPKSINGTYSSIFAAITNPDAQPCSQVLAAAVCSGAPAGSNTTKFNAIVNVNDKLCNEVFAAAVCNANRKLNSEIFAWIWEPLSNFQEMWALAFQVTGPVSAPAALEYAMNNLTNVKNYMSVSPNVHANGDPNP